jgi:tRNA nucleotidyltransferase/poly(A) polymerase
MPDYIYLLENRLSADQQSALRHLREAAREAGMILFLTGDAVRDLTSGHAVRDLEVAVHGNALKLKKTLEKSGASVWGEDETSRSLFLCFPGTVRVDVISTHRTEFPKPGKAVFHPASIQEDLRRRDFTVNAMAISLNEGSFGLLMDPLNGAADIEMRTLRLVSNYGFIEQPSLLIRAIRYRARLGWEMDPRTLTRYQNAKEMVVIEYLSAEGRSRELEQIGHEDDGLKVLRALEAEGWMSVLFPAWTSAKADEPRLQALHELAVDLLMQGVHADMSAAQMQLLTAKLSPKDLNALKKLMLRPGFVQEWNSLDSLAAGFAKVLLAKDNATPSTSYKLFTSYDPEAVLWLGFTSKDAAVKDRYHQFLKVWPEARQRIPHAQMQEMRITPELPIYNEVVQQLFLELIDGRLNTPEEIRAFLEPHSPPAPPPQVTIKRSRAKRGEAKLKERSYEDEDEEELDEEDEDLDDLGADEEEEMDLGIIGSKGDLEPEIGDEEEPGDEEDEEPVPAAPPKRKSAATKHAAKHAAPEVSREAAKPAAHKPATTGKPKPPVKPAKAAPPTKAPEVTAKTAHGTHAPKKAAAHPVKAAKPVPLAKAHPVRTSSKGAAKAPAKVSVNAAAKHAAKPQPRPAKAPAAKHLPVKKSGAHAASTKPAKTVKPVKAHHPAKPAAKKTAPKAGKKR